MTDNKLAGTIERLLYCDRNNCAPSAKTVKSSLEYVSAILEVNKSLEADNRELTAKVKELEKGHEADAKRINYLDQREVELTYKDSDGCSRDPQSFL